MTKKNIDTTTIGGRIKELRIKAGLSQDELAEKLHLGNRASVSSYETNRRSISGELTVEMAKNLNSTTDYILYGERVTSEFIIEATNILLFRTLSATLFSHFLRIKRRYSIKQLSAFSSRLFYEVPSLCYHIERYN